MTRRITSRARILTCLIVLAVVFATFLAGMFTSSAATDQVFESIELKVGDTIGLVYYTKQPYTAGTTMRFQINGRVSEVVAYRNNDKCVFVFDDIYPHEMAHPITGTIMVNGASTVSTTVTIKSYLLEILNSSTKAHLHQFASNMLQYGEKTREYRNAQVDKDDDVSILQGVDQNLYPNYTPDDLERDFTGEPAGLGMSAANVRMSAIGISYDNTNHLVITMTKNPTSTIQISDCVIRINGTLYRHDQFTQDPKDANSYRLTSASINAYDLLDTFNIQLEVNGTIVQTATYSVYDYILQLQSTAEGTSLASQYARALYYYGQQAADVYPGKTVVALTPNTNPSNITVTNQLEQTPTGGNAMAYYSDGTSAQVNVAWSKVTGISDTTYSVTRNTIGTYTDPVSGKTFSVNASVKLLNPSKSITRYTDPSQYNPTSYVASYKPEGGKVRVHYSNGATALADPTYSAVNMSSFKTTEFASITVTAQWTHGITGTTHTTNMNLVYNNPIKSMSAYWGGGTITFSGSTSTALNKAQTYYRLKYANGTTTSWAAASTNTNFSVTNATYDGILTSGTLSCTAYYAASSFSTTIYDTSGNTSSITLERGRLKDNQAVDSGQTKLSSIPFSNPMSSITIAQMPQATITSTAAPTTDNGMLSGGTIDVTLANGKAISAVSSGVKFFCTAGHDTTDYSKSVYVYAQYSGLESSKTAKTITLVNPVVSVTQGTVPTMTAKDIQTNFALAVSNVTGTLTVTYKNGKTASVAPKYFRLGTSTADYSTVYIANINTAIDTTLTRTTAAKGENSTTYSALKAYYKDERSGANYNKTIDFKVNITNHVVSLTEGTFTITLTSETVTTTTFAGNTVIKSIPATFSNGALGPVTPTSVTNISSSPSAKEVQETTCTVYYNSVSCTPTIHIVNPVTSISRYTDPSAYTVTNKNALTSANILDNGAGLVTVTYTSGHTKTDKPTSFTGLTNVKITDATMISQPALTANYKTKHSGTKTCTVYIILKNPPKSSALTLSVGSSSNKATLTRTGVQLTGTITTTYNNGATSTAYSNASFPILYKSGTTNSSTAATTTTSGTTKVKASCTIPASGTKSPYVNGASGSAVQTAGNTFTTPEVTAYWQLQPESIAEKYDGASVANYKTTQVTPWATVTATYSNGAQAEVTGLHGSKVANITDTTYQANRTSTVTYTLNGGSASCQISFTLTNKATAFSVSNSGQVYKFTGTTSRTIAVTGVVQLTNGRTVNTNASSVTQKSCTGNQVTSPSISGYNITFTCSSAAAGTTTFTGTAKTTTHGGASAQFSFTLQNAMSRITAYATSSYTNNYFMNYTTYSENYYPRLTLNSSGNVTACRTIGGGSVSAPTGNKIYMLVTYSNGKTWRTSWGGTTASNWKWTTAPTHTVASTYRNSADKYNSGALQQVTAQFTQGGLTQTVTFYCIPYCTYTSGDNWTRVTKVKDTPDDGDLTSTDFTVTYDTSERRTFSNGKSRDVDVLNKTASGASDSIGWYWGYTSYATNCNSNSTDKTACKWGNTKSYAIGCKWTRFTKPQWLSVMATSYRYGVSPVSDLGNGTDNHDYCCYLVVPFYLDMPTKRDQYVGVMFSWYKANWSEGATTTWCAPDDDNKWTNITDDNYSIGSYWLPVT